MRIFSAAIKSMGASLTREMGELLGRLQRDQLLDNSFVLNALKSFQSRLEIETEDPENNLGFVKDRLKLLNKVLKDNLRQEGPTNLVNIVNVNNSVNECLRLISKINLAIECFENDSKVMEVIKRTWVTESPIADVLSKHVLASSLGALETEQLSVAMIDFCTELDIHCVDEVILSLDARVSETYVIQLLKSLRGKYEEMHERISRQNRFIHEEITGILVNNGKEKYVGLSDGAAVNGLKCVQINLSKSTRDAINCCIEAYRYAQERVSHLGRADYRYRLVLEEVRSRVDHLELLRGALDKIDIFMDKNIDLLIHNYIKLSKVRADNGELFKDIIPIIAGLEMDKAA